MVTLACGLSAVEGGCSPRFATHFLFRARADRSVRALSVSRRAFSSRHFLDDDGALAYQGGQGVVGGDRRIPSYGGDYRYAREDKGVEVQLLLFESFGGFGKGVREILRKAADVLQNKLTRAQYLDEVTWTTKNWLGLQKQRISVVLHTAIAEQVANGRHSQHIVHSRRRREIAAGSLADQRGVQPKGNSKSTQRHSGGQPGPLSR